MGKLVHEDAVRRLCEKAKEILTAEPNVVPVRAPITVVRARALASPGGGFFSPSHAGPRPSP